MEMRNAYLSMIRAFPGGWDAMSAALGMTRVALENRIYERKGQSLLVETAQQMQAFSATTFFAESIAQSAGGVFMQLPDRSDEGRDELLAKFTELYARLGDLSTKFREYVKDDEISRRERAVLEGVAQQIHRTVEELLALTFQVYCAPGAER
jgi:predicted transcriptional regulator